jgi:uncharacterized protein (DUF1778 family)
MSRVVNRKERLLLIRLPGADVAIVDRAATRCGRSRTEFVREAAVRAAEDVLLETTPIRMSPTGFKAFLSILSKPTPAPELIELFQHAAPWESKP